MQAHIKILRRYKINDVLYLVINVKLTFCNCHSIIIIWYANNNGIMIKIKNKLFL